VAISEVTSCYASIQGKCGLFGVCAHACVPDAGLCIQCSSVKALVYTFWLCFGVVCILKDPGRVEVMKSSNNNFLKTSVWEVGLPIVQAVGWQSATPTWQYAGPCAKGCLWRPCGIAWRHFPFFFFFFGAIGFGTKKLSVAKYRRNLSGYGNANGVRTSILIV
jgi:hypothetical protein